MIRPRRRWPVAKLPALAAVAMLIVVAACGTGEPDAPDGPDPTIGPTLTISVVAAEGADPQAYELTCDPPGGDHPQPEQACAAIEAAGATVFDPVPKDQVCTMIYGGPQTAKVTGTYAGARVDAEFSRTNGCEIARWEKLGTTVFAIPMQ